MTWVPLAASTGITSMWWFWPLVFLILAGAVVWLVRQLTEGRDIGGAPSLDADLEWETKEQIAASLDKVYAYATEYAKGSIDWYAKRRKPKRVYGIALRASAIVLTALAGLVPIVPNLFEGVSVPAAVSTLALALAALFVSLDHFGGFTSGWVRYMFAQQEIERLRHAFMMKWQAWRAKSGAGLDVEQGLALLGTFLASVNKVIGDETKEWAAEFQSALTELERAAKEASDATATGALHVTVTNPGAVDGWTLEVDGLSRGNYTSGNAVVTSLPPRIHKVRASGSRGDTRLAGEAAVSVAADHVEPVELTLT